jgi:DNA primase
MCKIQNISGSDGYSYCDSENRINRENNGWEIENPFSYEKKNNVKITKELITFINNKIKLYNVFQKYNIDFEEKYSPSGWTLVTICPFPDHNDSEPSFNYNKEENRFFCFGCKRGGKAVQFVSYMENISFEKSAEKLISSIGKIEEVYIESQNQKKDDIDNLLLNFSNSIYDFINHHKKTIKAIKYAENITWALDVYMQKHLPSSSISEDNLNERIKLLIDRLDDYVE